MREPIYVNRPFLPPLEDLVPLLERIWATRILTNNGPFHVELEARLRAFFGVDQVSLTTNGMLALTTAIDAAGLEGEVITTPYSFVATTHAVKMGRLTPVFVDIRPDDLNIDAERIEAAITPRTTAIVAVHCYGNPCQVDRIEEIGRRRNLRVIYDAAHAFGVRFRGRSLLSWGDYAALSFHATKAFNTFEGGAIVSASAGGKAAADAIRNFGIANEVDIPEIGTNAKMSEFNAALGLLQLDRFEDVRAARRTVDGRYRAALRDVAGVVPLALPADVTPNYSYFPVLIGVEYPETRDELYERLRANGIFSRRYFYPLLAGLPMYRDLPSASRDNLPVANDAADRILCLPIYPDLASEDQDRIIALIADKVR